MSPELVRELRNMTPQERLGWLHQRLNFLINITESGVERNAMTEANIAVMQEMKA